MRPLYKGNTPLDAAGNPITVTDYDRWRLRLINRIGYYCAYCNQPLSHSLQVEHVVPKNPPLGYTPGDPLTWDNMLLACGPCNNAKDNQPIDAATYYLPEEHNTHLPFTITAHANYAVATERVGLTPAQQQKARRTIDLLQLDAIDTRDAIVDIRSRRRKDAMMAVEANRQVFDLARHSSAFDISYVATLIKSQVIAIGFFSLWYEAYSDVPEVLEQLITIVGTAINCFDEANGYVSIGRNLTNGIDTF